MPKPKPNSLVRHAVGSAVIRPDTKTEHEIYPIFKTASSSKRKTPETPTTEPHSKKKKTKMTDKWKATWFHTYPWLVKTEDGKAKCSICRDFSIAGLKGLFGTVGVSGVQSINSSSFARHQRESAEHKQAVDNQIGSQSLRTAFISTSDARQGVVSCFHAVYWLAKEFIANRKYTTLRSLLSRLQVPFMDVLDARGNASYTSHQFFNEALEAISDVIELLILEEVHASPAVGVTIDETKDASCKEQMDLYWRYVNMMTGRIRSRFAGLRECKNGTSDTLTEMVMVFLHEQRVPFEKLLGFGSDGASALMGTENGVATQLQRENPRMVIGHGNAHNLALAAGQAADDVPYLAKNYCSILTSLYILYEYSPKKTATLSDTQADNDEPQYNAKRAETTRWASRMSAVHGIFDTLPSQLESIEKLAENGADATAIGLKVLMYDYRFVLATASLDDILPVVNILSTAMQAKDADFTVIVNMLPSVLKCLEDMKTMFGPSYSELPERLCPDGDLHEFKLRYGDDSNVVHQNAHAHIHLG